MNQKEFLLAKLKAARAEENYLYAGDLSQRLFLLGIYTCERCYGFPVCKDTWLPERPCHAFNT